MAGLRSASFNEGSIVADNAKLSLVSTDLFEGPDALAEYTSLVSFGKAADNTLIYNSCFLKEHFDVIVNSISFGYCDVTAAAILTGKLNESYVSNSDMGIEAVSGYRFSYALGKRSSTPIKVDKVHTFLVNPFVNTFVPFDQDLTTDTVCNILENVCGEDFFTPFQNHSECVAAMDTLPIGQWDIDGQWSYNGNSTGCRAVESILASRNPNLHCPHLSWNHQADANGNYKCNDMALDRSGNFNWTTDELNLFKRLAAERNIFEAALARYHPVDQKGQCAEDPGSVLFEVALQDSNKFEELNGECYQYLQELDATPDMMTTYWCSLFGLMVGLRMIAAYLLHRNSSTSI